MNTTTTILACTLALAGCGDCGRPHAAPSAQTAGTTVPAIRAERLVITRETAADSLPATVRAARRAGLAARIPGTWLEVTVKEGDTVTAGTTLARIHAPEWSARLTAAKAARDLASADHARTVKLRLAAAATPAEMDAANARLASANAAVDEARARLADTALVAPFDGRVTRKLVRAGDAAAPGVPAIVVEDPTSLEIEVALPESEKIPATGERLTVELRGRRITPAGTEVSPATDPTSRTRTVRARLEPGVDALPGEFARVSLRGDSGAPRIFIPAEAVMRRGQVESLWIESSGRAELRLVRTGRAEADRVEILSGLSGDETPLKPAAEITEGATIR